MPSLWLAHRWLLLYTSQRVYVNAYMSVCEPENFRRQVKLEKFFLNIWQHEGASYTSQQRKILTTVSGFILLSVFDKNRKKYICTMCILRIGVCTSNFCVCVNVWSMTNDRNETKRGKIWDIMQKIAKADVPIGGRIEQICEPKQEQPLYD